MSKRFVTYLCGPINGCTDEECRDWREAAKVALTTDHLDPMRRDYRGREDECIAEIVEGDKADIDKSDILLVNHPGPSTGTDMEILLAWQAGKLVVVVVPQGVRVSPWLRYHSHHLFHTFTAAYQLINELQTNSPS